jgi:O-antigen ligase
VAALARWRGDLPLAGFALAALLLGLVAGISPFMAVAAVCGLAFVAVILADLRLGLCLFILLAFLGLLPTFGASVSVIKLIGAVLTLSWLAAITLTEQGGQRTFMAAHPLMVWVAVAFIAWATVSLVWAEDSAAVLTSVGRYLPNVVLIVIVYSAMRTTRDAVWPFAAFVAGAAISAAYGLVTTPSVSGTEELDRVTGTVGDPNELAVLLLVGMIFGIALAVLARRSAALRLLAAGTSLLCALGLLLSLSRGGLVALAVALVASVVMGGRWRWRAALAAVVIVVATFVFYFAFVPASSRDRLTASDGGAGRTDIWTVGWRMVQDHPIIGVGAGNFQVSSVHYVLRPGSLRRDELIVERHLVAHNTYLHVLAELGIVGLALFASLIVFSLRCALLAAHQFARRRNLGMEVLCRAFIISLVGMLAADFFISEQFSKQLWLLIALGPALLGVARRDAPMPPPQRVPRAAPRRREPAAYSSA